MNNGEFILLAATLRFWMKVIARTILFVLVSVALIKFIFHL